MASQTEHLTAMAALEPAHCTVAWQPPTCKRPGDLGHWTWDGERVGFGVGPAAAGSRMPGVFCVHCAAGAQGDATLPLERPAPPACCCWSFRLPAPDEPPVTCCSSSSWNFRRSSRFSFLSSSNFISLCSSSMQVRSPPLSLPQPSDTGHWTQCSVSVRGCVIRPLTRCVAPSFLSVASCTGQALDGKAVTNLTRNHLSEVLAVVEVLW